MKRLLFPLMICLACFALGMPEGSAKQKSKKPTPTLYRATLFSPTLSSTWALEIVVDEVSTDEGIKELAQAYASGGERALNKAMNKLHRGYCDLGPNKMEVKLVQSKRDGVNRRIGILATFPVLSPILQTFADLPEYPYVYIQLQLDEQGVGKGSLTPKARIAFNPQGQVTLETRASEPFELRLVKEMK